MGDNTRVIRAGMIAAATLLAAAAPSHAIFLPPGFSERGVAGGLETPTAVAYTPDGRVLITEKAGRLKVLNPGETEPKVVLDLSRRTASNNDRGMLALDVDSSFAKNGYVYVGHVLLADPSNYEGPQTARLLRIKLGRDNRVLARKVILGSDSGSPCPKPDNSRDCMPVDGGSHSVGEVKSAADGTVWFSLGDSSSTHDKNRGFPYPPQRAQNEAFFGGKLIHVDRNGRGLRGHPFCPGDDDLDHVCTKIHAKGFRNPFRFHLTARGPVVADVGWTAYEELNRVVKGGNYGWPCYEGPRRALGVPDSPECQAAVRDPMLRMPLLAYANAGNASIISGPRYTGGTFPRKWRGRQFFADYARAEIRYLDADSVDWASSGSFAADWAGVDLEQSPSGGLVYANVGFYGPKPGSIWEIIYTGDNRLPVPAFRARPRYGPAPLRVRFDAGASKDRDGDRLRFLWLFGDGGRATGRRAEHVFRSPKRQTVTLVVDDGRGEKTRVTKDVWPGNRSKPRIAWTRRPRGYRPGRAVRLSVRAFDGARRLGGGRVSWHVLLRHGAHRHEVTRATGTRLTFHPAQDHGAGSAFIVAVTAADAAGLGVTRRALIPYRP